MSLKFKKNKEDFICQNCGFKVKGTGYTNHCPNCLWSKHVDVYPGDRKNSCQGLMKPIRIEVKNDSYFIIHQCLKCLELKKNQASENDNFEEIFKIFKDQNFN